MTLLGGRIDGLLERKDLAPTLRERLEAEAALYGWLHEAQGQVSPPGTEAWHAIGSNAALVVSEGGCIVPAGFTDFAQLCEGSSCYAALLQANTTCNGSDPLQA